MFESLYDHRCYLTRSFRRKAERRCSTVETNCGIRFCYS
jgi:hypothetical protein